MAALLGPLHALYTLHGHCIVPSLRVLSHERDGRLMSLISASSNARTTHANCGECSFPLIYLVVRWCKTGQCTGTPLACSGDGRRKETAGMCAFLRPPTCPADKSTLGRIGRPRQLAGIPARQDPHCPRRHLGEIMLDPNAVEGLILGKHDPSAHMRMRAH